MSALNSDALQAHLEASHPKPLEPQAGATRLDHLDGIRALAALAVLGYHTTQAFFGSVPDTFAERLCNGLSLGVMAFLPLSGYCLCLPYVKRQDIRINLADYAKKRFLRIAPPYWIVLLLLAPLTHLPAYAARKTPVDLPNLVTHLTFTHNLFGKYHHAISPAFWSIALEVQFYIAFPLLLRFMASPRTRTGLLSILAICSLFWYVVGSATQSPQSERGIAWLQAFPGLLVVFASGMVAAWVCKNNDSPRVGVRRFSAVLFLIGFLVYVFTHTPFVAYLACGGAVALFLSSGSLQGIGVRWLSWKPLVVIGHASYTLYLIHHPIVALAGSLVARHLPGAFLYPAFAIVTGAVVLLSLFLYNFIEKPFIALQRSRGRAPASG